MIPTKNQWRRWSLPSKLSFVSSAMSVFGLILSMYFYLVVENTKVGMDKKIEELSNIQLALSTLTNYVESQKDNLETLSRQKQSLEVERERIQKILDVDQEKLEALFEYQNAKQRQSAWFEYAISFLVGVLSSSLVTFITISFQNKKHNKSIQPTADAAAD